MSDNQSGKLQRKQSSPGKIALMGAVATGLGVFNLVTNGGEAPSQAVMILQYGLLGLGLVGLAGGLIMMATAKN